ncbi:MAG: peptidoglycan-binding protein, partial [Pseudomonadota bacterium]|nr:peptidoglycan-binding protein [Pseudomonadota bacterium]
MAIAQPAPLPPVPPGVAKPSLAPAPSAPPAAKPDPAFETAKRAFEALPEAERQRIQEALVWTGDLNGSADGTFGRRTYEAILSYQRHTKAAVSGTLDERARAGLAQAMRRAQDAAGFKVVADPATGIVIGVPERILPKRDVNPRAGSRWQSTDDKITLDTRAIPAGETDLTALFERNLTIQTPGRQVTY